MAREAGSASPAVALREMRQQLEKLVERVVLMHRDGSGGGRDCGDGSQGSGAAAGGAGSASTVGLAGIPEYWQPSSTADAREEAAAISMLLQALVVRTVAAQSMVPGLAERVRAAAAPGPNPAELAAALSEAQRTLEAERSSTLSTYTAALAFLGLSAADAAAAVARAEAASDDASRAALPPGLQQYSVRHARLRADIDDAQTALDNVKIAEAGPHAAVIATLFPSEPNEASTPASAGAGEAAPPPWMRAVAAATAAAEWLAVLALGKPRLPTPAEMAARAAQAAEYEQRALAAVREKAAAAYAELARWSPVPIDVAAELDAAEAAVRSGSTAALLRLVQREYADNARDLLYRIDGATREASLAGLWRSMRSTAASILRCDALYEQALPTEQDKSLAALAKLIRIIAGSNLAAWPLAPCVVRYPWVPALAGGTAPALHVVRVVGGGGTAVSSGRSVPAFSATLTAIQSPEYVVASHVSPGAIYATALFPKADGSTYICEFTGKRVPHPQHGVVAVDAKTGAVRLVALLPFAPWIVKEGPDGCLLMLHGERGASEKSAGGGDRDGAPLRECHLARLDPSTGVLQPQVASFHHPQDVAVHPLTRHVYVSDYTYEAGGRGRYDDCDGLIHVFSPEDLAAGSAASPARPRACHRTGSIRKFMFYGNWPLVPGPLAFAPIGDLYLRSRDGSSGRSSSETDGLFRMAYRPASYAGSGDPGSYDNPVKLPLGDSSDTWTEPGAFAVTAGGGGLVVPGPVRKGFTRIDLTPGSGAVAALYEPSSSGGHHAPCEKRLAGG